MSPSARKADCASRHGAHDGCHLPGRQRVDAEAERLAALGATVVRVLHEEGLDHYGVAMAEPEGNEFDIN
jgi:hypothetical protein